MGQGRRCCCCRDVYYYNADSTFERLHVPTPTDPGRLPTLKDRITNGIYQDFKVDYRNKQIVVQGLIAPAGSTVKQPTLNITDSLRLDTQNGVVSNWLNLKKLSAYGGIEDPGFGVGGRITDIKGIALDWKNKRIFYVVCNQTFTDTHGNTFGLYGIRSQNYDGTNDHLVSLESQFAYPAPNTTFFRGRQFLQRTLTYNANDDKLYYGTFYATTLNGSTFTYEIRSVKSDGTGQTTIVDMTSAFPNTGFSLVGLSNFFGGCFSFVQNKAVMDFVCPQQVGVVPVQNCRLTTINLLTGTNTIILESDVGTNLARRMFYPQECTSDDLIYFFSQGVSPTAPQVSGLNSIKWDGVGEKQLFNFGTTQNPNEFFWEGQNISPNQVLFLGCGIEKTGTDFVGPNG